MKYMHFKASCAYTALASIMETKGIDTEDCRIALEIKLPWLFAREDDTFLSGPMLQGAKWFDLWLVPQGFSMEERLIARADLCRYLRDHEPAMLGIQTPYGKHAVVFAGYDGNYRFLNPTHEGSGESAVLLLNEEELLSAVAEAVMVGEVLPTEPAARELAPLLSESVSVIRENCAAIAAFSGRSHEPDDYFPMLNKLFRSLLLDGITMLEIAGEKELAREFTALQGQLMGFLRGTREGILRDVLDLGKLQELTERYVRLIEAQI